jgi:hypothetical protein
VFPFGFGLLISVTDVDAVMAYWNKVSHTSLYLVGVRFGVNEGP